MKTRFAEKGVDRICFTMQGLAAIFFYYISIMFALGHLLAFCYIIILVVHKSLVIFFYTFVCFLSIDENAPVLTLFFLLSTIRPIKLVLVD